MDLIRHHVAGQSVGSAERTGPVYDPRPVPCRPRCLRLDRRDGCRDRGGRGGAPAWRATSLIKRADVFFRLRHLLVERADELAAIITAEHGKVLSDAKGEISRGIENVEFAAGSCTC
jgi:malonate-semialdehyde dehydrogenase (acetylating)/methylmalonate-semialdehyde dehydrogenase